METYDLATNSWSYAASLPQAEEAPAVAVDLNDHIDVMGGFDGASVAPTYYNNLFVYDGTTWSGGAPMPTARQDLGAARGADGRIYAVGGFGGNGWVTAVEAFDPGNGSWSGATPLPSAECCMGVTSTPDGYIYAIGGNQYAAKPAKPTRALMRVELRTVAHKRRTTIVRTRRCLSCLDSAIMRPNPTVASGVESF